MGENVLYLVVEKTDLALDEPVKTLNLTSKKGLLVHRPAQLWVFGMYRVPGSDISAADTMYHARVQIKRYRRNHAVRFAAVSTPSGRVDRNFPGRTACGNLLVRFMWFGNATGR